MCQCCQGLEGAAPRAALKKQAHLQVVAQQEAKEGRCANVDSQAGGHILQGQRLRQEDIGILGHLFWRLQL